MLVLLHIMAASELWMTGTLFQEHPLLLLRGKDNEDCTFLSDSESYLTGPWEDKVNPMSGYACLLYVPAALYQNFTKALLWGIVQRISASQAALGSSGQCLSVPPLSTYWW